jgi:hypothetical protein
MVLAVDKVTIHTKVISLRERNVTPTTRKTGQVIHMFFSDLHDDIRAVNLVTTTAASLHHEVPVGIFLLKAFYFMK